MPMVTLTISAKSVTYRGGVSVTLNGEMITIKGTFIDHVRFDGKLFNGDVSIIVRPVVRQPLGMVKQPITFLHEKIYKVATRIGDLNFTQNDAVCEIEIPKDTFEKLPTILSIIRKFYIDVNGDITDSRSAGDAIELAGGLEVIGYDVEAKS